jgi:cation diffusion facilitator CzcD-associated flavoprotein CzcO
MLGESTDVAIVGSGPYALSLAAHCRERGVEFRVFGPAMQFWRDMPVGINLKSYAFATNLYVPAKGYQFPEWCRANGLEDFEPCTMQSFARYGMWVKDSVVPDLDETMVDGVASRTEGGFDVRLADGRRLQARRVVVATGLSNLAYVPDVLAPLPRALVSHTQEHRDYHAFRGKDVAIIGGGASAVEAGALVHEAGGRPIVLMREEVAHFGTRLRTERSLIDRVRRPNSVLGVGMKGWLFQHVPLYVRLLPENQRLRMVRTTFGPSSPWWILTRVWGRVPIFVQTKVLGATEHGSRVRLRVHEQGHGERDIDVDHVIAGTGYVSNVDRLPFLDAGLRGRIRRVEGAPWVQVNFETSVPGLFFAGPIVANCFGPLYRFVAGAEYAAPAIARQLAGPVRAVTSAVRRHVLRAPAAAAPAAPDRRGRRAPEIHQDASSL